MLGRCRDTQEDHLGGNSNQPAGKQGTNNRPQNRRPWYTYKAKDTPFRAPCHVYFHEGVKRPLVGIGLHPRRPAIGERVIMVSCLSGLRPCHDRPCAVTAIGWQSFQHPGRSAPERDRSWSLSRAGAPPVPTVCTGGRHITVKTYWRSLIHI